MASEFNSEQGIIYNVTVQVDHGVATPWLQWMQEEHIPDVMATGCFQDFRILRLMEVDEREGLTYAVQYRAAFRSDYNRYIAIFAEGLRQKAYNRWGDRFIAFRSVMEIVH